jgi:chromosome partitioning protein
MAGKVFTIAQQKGGAGKTTLVSHLAVAWTAAGKRVAVVDIDPQQSLTMWYEVRRKAMGDAGAGVLASQITGWRAAAAVERLAGAHDVVLIDSPPHAETEAKIAIRAADLVIVPVQPSPMDVWATRPTLELARQEGRPAVIVLNRVPPRARLTDDMLDEVRALGAEVAKARLGSRVAFAAALAAGQAVLEMAPKSPAAREIEALAKELLRRAR